MTIIVQKYGGSSVATEAKLHHVASRLLALKQAGHGVVTVVSAMGNTTNRLLDLAQGINQSPPGRELDLLLSSGERIASSVLAMAIRAHGVPAIALTGAQTGIRTSDTHLRARIVGVDTTRVQQELAHDRLVVVAGFQGVNSQGEITTLGRGGSDTTAVALAAALQANTCDICSDVDGIYSADPHLVDGALRLPALHYDEMEALAHHGAKVLNLRAVAYAKKHGVTIHARSSFHENKGTLVNGERRRQAQVIGIASLTRLVRLELLQQDTQLSQRVLELCGKDNLYFDSTSRGGAELLISTLNMPDHEHVCGELERSFRRYLKVVRDVGAVSIVGRGVGDWAQSQRNLEPDSARDAVQSSFSTADTHTCIVEERQVPDTVRAFHKRFVEERPRMAAA